MDFTLGLRLRWFPDSIWSWASHHALLKLSVSCKMGVKNTNLEDCVKNELSI